MSTVPGVIMDSNGDILCHISISDGTLVDEPIEVTICSGEEETVNPESVIFDAKINCKSSADDDIVIDQEQKDIEEMMNLLGIKPVRKEDQYVPMEVAMP